MLGGSERDDSFDARTGDVIGEGIIGDVTGVVMRDDGAAMGVASPLGGDAMDDGALGASIGDNDAAACRWRQAAAATAAGGEPPGILTPGAVDVALDTGGDEGAENTEPGAAMGAGDGEPGIVACVARLQTRALLLVLLVLPLLVLVPSLLVGHGDDNGDDDDLVSAAECCVEHSESSGWCVILAKGGKDDARDKGGHGYGYGWGHLLTHTHNK